MENLAYSEQNQDLNRKSAQWGFLLVKTGTYNDGFKR